VSKEAFEKWFLDTQGYEPFNKSLNQESEERAMTAWESWQAAKVDAVPEGSKFGLFESLLHTVQDALHDAYQNAGLVCCGKSMIDCCGSPLPEWSEADQKIMDVLSPIQRELSALLSASHNPTLSTKPDQ
jgi:hypothetical protein